MKMILSQRILLFVVFSALDVSGFLQPSHHYSAHAAAATATSTTTRLYDTYALFNIIQAAPPVVAPPVEVVEETHRQLGQLIDNTENYSNAQSAATSLFTHMLTPSSILAGGIISIGLKAPFQLPPSIPEHRVKRIESLKRAYIIVTLVSFCSELLAVMWATVAVNQLTERDFDLDAYATVWELLQCDKDLELAWAAVNSHFIVGLIGFMYMTGIRGYIMLLTAEASQALIISTASGVGAALLVMGSIVNRGVAGGGGQGVGYGETMLDLFGQYLTLFVQRSIGAADGSSFGPLGVGAIGLEIVSIIFAVYATFGSGVDQVDLRPPTLFFEQPDAPAGAIDLMANSIDGSNSTTTTTTTDDLNTEETLQSASSMNSIPKQQQQSASDYQ